MSNSSAFTLVFTLGLRTVVCLSVCVSIYIGLNYTTDLMGSFKVPLYKNKRVLHFITSLGYPSVTVHYTVCAVEVQMYLHIESRCWRKSKINMSAVDFEDMI